MECAGGGIIAIFFAPAGFGRGGGRKAGHARKPVSVGFGKASGLFRIGHCEDHGGDPQWRNFTALDEYTRTARCRRGLAGICSICRIGLCGDVVWNAGAGTRARLDDVFATAHSNRLFFHRITPWQSGSFSAKLHVSELPSYLCWGSVARRSVRGAVLAAIMKEVISPPKRPSHWAVPMPETNGERNFASNSQP